MNSYYKNCALINTLNNEPKLEGELQVINNACYRFYLFHKLTDIFRVRLCVTHRTNVAVYK